MALIQCGECGNNISDKASACPGCGCPVKIADTIGLNDSIPPKQSPPNSTPNNSPTQEQAWSISATVLMGLATFFIPILGMIAGIYGVCKKAKRGQGVLLIVISIVAWVSYGVIFTVIAAIMRAI